MGRVSEPPGREERQALNPYAFGVTGVTGGQFVSGSRSMAIAPGTHLGRYEIRSQLGAGGMGEVYLAQDMRLERAVALKILPGEVASDQQRMQRFIQEAKAASALNHPNIITIHEVEQIDSIHLIATEFINGETLRVRMARGRVTISEALDVAFQVASALAAAHEAGIIHRDIKPENIMLRRDAIVKVLDFGLAKLTERRSLTIDAEAATRALVNTAPGMVMGTAHYMSPEQARGIEVDARTDIWSLGVLLYEMVAGRAPFAGETAIDVIASIMKTEPAPLTRYAPEIPAELQRIVAKTLDKEREDRYQGIKDLLVDLRRLKKRLDFETEMERSAPPQSNTGAMAATGSAPHEAAAGSSSKASSSTVIVEPARATSSAEYFVSEIKRHKQAVVTAVVLLLLTISVIGFALYKLRGTSDKPSEPIGIARLTTNGKAFAAAISPDGKYVVYAVNEGGQQSLWVRQVATSSNVQIAPSAEVAYNALTFSPDSNYINYVKKEKNAIAALYQMPVLGGAAKKLLTNAGGEISYSPDGKQFAFVRGNYPNLGDSSLTIAQADGTGGRILVSRQKPETFPWWEGQGPAWSPDGKSIACVVGGVNSGSAPMSVIEARVADGTVKPITAQPWYEIKDVAWLQDKSGLLILAADNSASFYSQQIWRISYPNGEARRVTTDFNNYVGMSLTADSNKLVALQSNRLSNIWVVPGADASRAVQIKSGGYNYEGIDGLAWTPDGRIVYYSRASGADDIWMMNGDGTGQKQLTVDASANYDLSVTRDGRYIVFVSERNGQQNLWRMDLDGGDPKQLTSGKGDVNPTCAPDSQWIIYNSDNSGKPTLWKVSIEGGNETQLIEQASENPEVSPDGKLIVCQYREDINKPWRYAFIPYEGGAPVKVFDLPGATINLRWTPDGRALTYYEYRNGASNIWALPLDGSAPKQLTDFKTDHIFNFRWSMDGKQMALARGTTTSDVVMISNFR